MVLPSLCLFFYAGVVNKLAKTVELREELDGRRPSFPVRRLVVSPRCGADGRIARESRAEELLLPLRL